VAGQGDGRRAVVVGDGPIALLNSIVLRLRGFESVLMIHGRSTRGGWATAHGYFERADVISSRGDVAVKVAERFNGEPADVAVICTPGEAVESSVLTALEYLKPGGLINFVSCAIPSVISLRSGDLDVQKLQRRNHSGLPTGGYVEDFESASRKIVKMTGQHGTSSAHIQAAVDLLTTDPQPFNKLITDVVCFDKADSFISSAVEWSLGRGVGDRPRPMKAVIELNEDSLFLM